SRSARKRFSASYRANGACSRPTFPCSSDRRMMSADRTSTWARSHPTRPRSGVMRRSRYSARNASDHTAASRLSERICMHARSSTGSPRWLISQSTRPVMRSSTTKKLPCPASPCTTTDGLGSVVRSTPSHWSNPPPGEPAEQLRLAPQCEHRRLEAEPRNGATHVRPARQRVGYEGLAGRAESGDVLGEADDGRAHRLLGHRAEFVDGVEVRGASTSCS